MLPKQIFAFIATAGILLTLRSSGAKGDDGLQPPKELPQWVMLSATADGKITTEHGTGSHDETVTQTYTVHVPYTVIKADGTTENLTRPEKRERTVIVKRVGPHRVTWRAKDLKFLDVMGNEIDPKGVVDRLQTPVAALSVTKPEVHPFYAAILKPDVVVVVLPSKNPK